MINSPECRILKNILKIVVTLFILGTVVQTAIALPILFPQYYFDNKYIYNNYTVYSDQEITSDIHNLLDDVSSRLSGVAIDEPNKNYDLFICHDIETYWKFVKILGRGKFSQGVTTSPLNNTYISLSSIEQIRRKYGNEYKYTLLEGSPEHIIAHELAHQLIAEKLGYFKERNLIEWKREGYAEYTASNFYKRSDNNYSFLNRLENLYSGKYNDLTDSRKYYIRSELLIEYLIDIKGFNFEQIIESETLEENVLSELQTWYSNNHK